MADKKAGAEDAGQVDGNPVSGSSDTLDGTPPAALGKAQGGRLVVIRMGWGFFRK